LFGATFALIQMFRKRYVVSSYAVLDAIVALVDSRLQENRKKSGRLMPVLPFQATPVATRPLASFQFFMATRWAGVQRRRS